MEFKFFCVYLQVLTEIKDIFIMLKSPIKASFIPISGFSDTFKQKKREKKNNYILC